jgi:hypothetical protein
MSLFLLFEHGSQGAPGIVQSGFHGSSWDAEHAGNFFERKVLQEKQRQYFSVRQGYLPKAIMNVLGIFEAQFAVVLLDIRGICVGPEQSLFLVFEP